MGGRKLRRIIAAIMATDMATAAFGVSLILSNSPSSLNLISPAATKGFSPSYFLRRAMSLCLWLFIFFQPMRVSSCSGYWGVITLILVVWGVLCIGRLFWLALLGGFLGL